MASFNPINSCSISTVAAPPARTGEGVAQGGSDILHCEICGKACSSVLDAGFDPRLHGMAVYHAACRQKEGGGA